MKVELLQKLTELREERTALIDRAKVVITELAAKGGEVEEPSLYIDAVSGLNVDVSDVSSASSTILGWLKSPEGGIRWAFNIAKFAGTIFAFWIISLIAMKITGRALARSRNASELLKSFLVGTVKKMIFLMGVIVALSALELDIGPLLAVIGAGGLVIGLALQGTLSNFASGILILFYRPFDVGDFVEVAGIAGKVGSMNLVSTMILTPDNKRMIVPNNAIWGDIITNATGTPTRRVDLVFGIGYTDDIAKAESVLRQILEEHPAVLADPPPTIRLHELANSSVNFICRPWVNTPDYWDVYWDITRSVKERFDAEGISIPFPQTDVHFYPKAALPKE